MNHYDNLYPDDWYWMNIPEGTKLKDVIDLGIPSHDEEDNATINYSQNI